MWILAVKIRRFLMTVNDRKEHSPSLTSSSEPLCLTKTRNQICSQIEWSCHYFAGPVRRCIIQSHSPADRMQTWRIVNNRQSAAACCTVARCTWGPSFYRHKNQIAQIKKSQRFTPFVKTFADWFPWTSMLPGHCSLRPLCFQSAAVAAQHQAHKCCGCTLPWDGSPFFLSLLIVVSL